MTAVHPDHGILFVQIHQLLLCAHSFKSSDMQTGTENVPNYFQNLNNSSPATSTYPSNFMKIHW